VLVCNKYSLGLQETSGGSSEPLGKKWVCYFTVLSPSLDICKLNSLSAWDVKVLVCSPIGLCFSLVFGFRFGFIGCWVGMHQRVVRFLVDCGCGLCWYGQVVGFGEVKVGGANTLFFLEAE
jgi:hypothetical protein